MQSERGLFNLSKSDCAFLGASVLVAFFVIWFFWKALGWPSVVDLLSENNAAAWVQAVGSLVLVGVTVFLFYAGEKQRKTEKDAERKKDIDKAKMYLLQNGNVFGELEIFVMTNSIRNYDDSRRGEGSNLYHYPALDYYYVEYESIRRICVTYEIFMQMQVPMGVPDLCVSYIYEQQKIIRQISSLVNEERRCIVDLLALKAMRKRSFKTDELLLVAEMDLEFSYTIPLLKNLINELKSSYERMKSEIFVH